MTFNFAPTTGLVPYTPKRLTYNPIMRTDSYKFSHAFSYRKGVRGMFSYIEARTGGRDIMVPVGMQIWLNEHLSIAITAENIDEAEAFAAKHGEPFSRASWEKVLNEYHGYMPVTIRTVPEGTPVPSGNAIVTILCEDEDMTDDVAQVLLFWIASYLETQLLRAIWYPTTIASLDRNTKLELKRFYEIAGADLNFLPFALQDFGARGTTAGEQAGIGGASHTVSFQGSDTVEGVRYANFYYDCEMAAFSVRATEHSVACSFGLSDEDEIAYIDHQLTVFEGKGNIISMVGDSKSIKRFAKHLCTTFRDRIIHLHETLGMKVVCRPDSGDALEIIPMLLRMFAEAFPTTVTSKGYIKLYPGIGILQGDGIDRMSILTISGNIMVMNFSPDNIVFGSGGGLLQKVDRDTFKFAMKASAIKLNGEWIGIVKDPETDPGKKSKEGVLALVQNTKTGELKTVRIDNAPIPEGWKDAMVTVYDKGQFYNHTTLAEIRERAKV